MILWHHFALYPPLSLQAEPLLGSLVHWFSTYARSTQVFFVIGGYVMAWSLSARMWDAGAVGKFVAQRYCRLGIPYLAAIVLALAANAWGRGWLPESVVGSPPTVAQVLAHVFFLQELLGFEHLSAGLWFVCINFQLGLLYVGALWLRDAIAGGVKVRGDSVWIDVPMFAGWLLSAGSLFYFNRHAEFDSWALYFFPYFFMGIIIHRTTRGGRGSTMFWLFILLVVAAMCIDWRWRLASALLVGLALFGAESSGLSSRWPTSRWVARLGRVSYSLFLVHFPVLVAVAGLWTRLGWTSPRAAVAGLLTAFVGSVALAFAFHRFVEGPAANISRRWGSAGRDDNSRISAAGSIAIKQVPSEAGTNSV